MRLRIYTLHVPALAMRGDPQALDGAHLVPDGFSWGAFAFNVLWFLRHRLWIAALLVLVLLAGLVLAGRFAGLSPGAGFVIFLLASALIGLEASSLRRWTYGRRGKPARDAVLAFSADEAEAKAVARWLDPKAASRQGPAVTAPAARHGDDSVIGLFPAREGWR